MCVTAVLAATAVVAGAIGTYTSIQAANARKKSARFEEQMRRKELYQKREMSRLEALQRENVRGDEFARARSSALAAIGASNLGEHISFFQSIDPEAQKAFLRDVRAIRLNLAGTEASIATSVRVGEYRQKIESFNASLSKVGAIAEFIQTAASAANFYASMGTPQPAGAAAGGGTDANWGSYSSSSYGRVGLGGI